MCAHREEEVVAFRPFDDVNELMTRPAHMAAFIDYLLTQGFEDDMVM